MRSDVPLVSQDKRQWTQPQPLCRACISLQYTAPSTTETAITSAIVIDGPTMSLIVPLLPQEFMISLLDLAEKMRRRACRAPVLLSDPMGFGGRFDPLALPKGG